MARSWSSLRTSRSLLRRSSSQILNPDMASLPVYCISLSGANKRRKVIGRQVRSLGFSCFQFFEATDGRTLSYDDLIVKNLYDRAASIAHHRRDLSLAEIGCSLSRIRLWLSLNTANVEVALVIEDDVFLDAVGLSIIDIASFPCGWDVVFLHALCDQLPPAGCYSGNLYSLESYAGSAAAYLVSKSGIAKLLHSAFLISWAADGYLGAFMRDIAIGNCCASCNSYIFWPSCAVNSSL